MFKLIFLIFIVGLVVVLSFVLSFIRQIRQGIDNYKRQVNGDNDHPRRQTKTYGNQEGVVDQRPSSEKQKKIFPKDEGEYVDFTEE